MPRSRSPGKYPHWRESWLHDGLSPITTSLPAGTCRSDAPAWSGRQHPGRGSPGTPATLLTIHARRPVDLYNGVLQAPSMPGDSMITTCPARSWLSRARRTSTRSPGCSVGNMAVILYDTRMEQGASLGDLSLLMKGETLPAWTKWEGIPARPGLP